MPERKKELKILSYFNTFLLVFLMRHGHVNCLQPLFPGESGVDQLVEIIKVQATFCSTYLFFVSFCFTYLIFVFGPSHVD